MEKADKDEEKDIVHRRCTKVVYLMYGAAFSPRALKVSA
jgi:hypothetical protein